MIHSKRHRNQEREREGTERKKREETGVNERYCGSRESKDKACGV